MDMAQTLKDFWFLVAGAISVIVWLVRLESRGNRNTEDIRRIEVDIERERQTTEAMLREMRQDIKTLLQR